MLVLVVAKKTREGLRILSPLALREGIAIEGPKPRTSLKKSQVRYHHEFYIQASCIVPRQGALYQGMASIRRRFVSGHGFSRAEKAHKKRGL
jgi:hypothetical protein